MTTEGGVVKASMYLGTQKYPRVYILTALLLRLRLLFCKSTDLLGEHITETAGYRS